MAVASPSLLNLSMSRIFLAGPARTNPKSEIRNPKRAPNPNEKFSKPDQSARPRRLGFADLFLCSLEFVSDFGFRISDFGFCPPFLPNRRCPAEEDVGKTLPRFNPSTLQRFNPSLFPSIASTAW